jgi:malonyl-CoA O-methyltransferase
MSQPSSPAQSQLDSIAVAKALRRMARAPQPPWLHAEVGRRMAQRLELIRLKPKLLVDWWGHLGAAAVTLAQACPQARRIVVEPTPSLVQRSRAALSIRWWQGLGRRVPSNDVLNEEDALPDGAELVWANMMLHGVVDPPASMQRWHRTLRVGGFVMFSCLGPGTVPELRTLYRRLGWPVPTQAFVDMHDLGDMLVHAGFADPVMDQELLNLRWDTATAALDELRTLGGNVAPDRFAGLRTRGWRMQLLRELESLRGADGRIGLSFEIVFGHAFKAAPSLRVGERAVVSLEDMRGMVGLGRQPR